MNPAVLLLRLHQGNRPLEDYVEDFCGLASQLDFNEVALKDCFRFGLNESISFWMPGGRSSLSLAQYIDLALRFIGSPFTVGEADAEPEFHVVAAAEPEFHVVAAAEPEFHVTATPQPAPCHVTATPEQWDLGMVPTLIPTLSSPEQARGTFGPPTPPGLRLGLSVPRHCLSSAFPQLHYGPSACRLCRGPSSLRLLLGLSVTWLCFGSPILWLRLVPPICQLHRGPPSLRLHLGPQSHRLHLSLPIPQLRLAPPSLQHRLGPPCHRLHPGPSSLWLLSGHHVPWLRPSSLSRLCLPWLHPSSLSWLHPPRTLPWSHAPRPFSPCHAPHLKTPPPTPPAPYRILNLCHVLRVLFVLVSGATP
ncbi:uncharacterized protein LOC127441877 [Myxocyprinus asiaticus]|uniref:uncharacterized protein LOC127441877 n=1 Tax=Myxocyprinus asiaticus TaxID=70543 RepID=UPI0022234B15|nr:uncharacterized protein LOC127441877 [Myxocyprinus asiaticus]